MPQLPIAEQSFIDNKTNIADELIKIVGREAVLSEDVELQIFECDALASITSKPLLVVLPASSAEVASVLSFCHNSKIPVVPRGAGTSLCGGAVATQDAVIICLTRLNKILEIDYAGGSAKVQAGVTNSRITEAVSEKGYFYAPDPSSQVACTIGGNIGTNAGGAHCLKYGVTSNNLLGVTFVLPDGEIIEAGDDYDDVSGYDLLSLICGSEGQLGIVTEAIVKIIPAQPSARPVMLGFQSIINAANCVSHIMRSGLTPVAIEFMDKLSIEACEKFAKAGYPLDVEAMLIVEVEGDEAEIATQLSSVAQIAKENSATVVRESANKEDSQRIWLGRKSAFGAMGHIADYISMDGVIPLRQLPTALEEISKLSSEYGLKVANIFHAGDGNLHPLILYDANDDICAAKAEKLGDTILKMCVDLGGCLSGEHGIGLEKRDLMKFQYTHTELMQQISLKQVFDAHGQMNHAKVFPLDLLQ